MKVISFNINSIRTRIHQLVALINKYQPDVIGLQETKVQDEEFPEDIINSLGYHAYFYGQKTHYGVALLSKRPMKDIQKGFIGEETNAQRRFIKATAHSPTFGDCVIMNGYFPQGESRDHPEKFPNKQRFYENVYKSLSTYSPNNPLILLGDMNVAPFDEDVGIGEDNKKRWLNSGKCSFLPEERQWLDQLKQWGLTDTIDHFSGDNHQERLSWFDYRSKGFEKTPKSGLRIDLILTSNVLSDRCQQLIIDHEIRAMEKPSDHCPIVATFS